METVPIAGEASFRVETDAITFAVSRTGGMLAPAVFDLGGRLVQPFSIAPWCGTPDAKGLPPILRVLRGDFFCMPFGANETDFQGERHPLHGETANLGWRFEGLDIRPEATTLELSLETRVRKARIVKRITVRRDHPVLYCEHRIERLQGPMNYGHHAMLQLPGQEEAGWVSSSGFRRGQVFPGAFERPETGGYSSLRPGAPFDHLQSVPMEAGGRADLSRYPAREGFEDLAMISSDAGDGFAWTAVVVPAEGYAWLSLKDASQLPSTVLWHSNGGRHYPPWNGRHRGVLGVEEVCANFHFGLAESAAANPISDSGIPTFREFNGHSFSVRYAMAVVPVAGSPGAVKEVRVQGGMLAATLDSTAEVETPWDETFWTNVG